SDTPARWEPLRFWRWRGALLLAGGDPLLDLGDALLGEAIHLPGQLLDARAQLGEVLPGDHVETAAQPVEHPIPGAAELDRHVLERVLGLLLELLDRALGLLLELLEGALGLLLEHAERLLGPLLETHHLPLGVVPGAADLLDHAGSGSHGGPS